MAAGDQGTGSVALRTPYPLRGSHSHIFFHCNSPSAPNPNYHWIARQSFHWCLLLVA
jgi:hypothetical protein